MLTKDMRAEAGKHDAVLSQLFSDYECPEHGVYSRSRRELTDMIDLAIAGMVSTVPAAVVTEYRRIYDVLKEVYAK